MAMWEVASVRPAWWSPAWWLMVSLRPSSAVTTSHILTSETMPSQFIHAALYFIPSRTPLPSLRRGLWQQQQAESGSCWQLATAWRSCLTRPQLPVTSRQLGESESQHNKRDSQVCEGWSLARMTSTFTHSSLDLTLKSVFIWYLNLDASIWLIQSHILPWCTFDKSQQFLWYCFSKLLSFPCSITSFTIPGMY